MLKRICQNKRAQNTAEYAILISLVVAGVMAMQQFAQRALQARERDASVFLAKSTNGIGNTVQYEPYYKKSDSNKNTSETKSTNINGTKDTRSTKSGETGYTNEVTKYDTATTDKRIDTNGF
ncbi:MAG: hypothetical protein HQL26_10370 [Candidatus Omnitrophica bacterium]|nr:hypothetical protein [Candidatus Omnitrophota bacterium]